MPTTTLLHPVAPTAVDRLPPHPAPALEIQPLSGHIGAEVVGLRLAHDLPPATLHAVRDALLRHRVLFFRGQHHLDDDGHQALGLAFGEIEAHPTVPAPQGTRLFELDSRHGGRANSWHTDVTFKAAPPAFGLLRAVQIPALGGDTMWASTVAAYDSLPAPMKTLAEQLWARHGNDYDYGANRQDNEPDTVAQARRTYRQVFVRELYEAEHPVVTVHPETGERALLLGHFVKRILGFNTHDSQRLFEVLHAHVLRPEHTVRWRWRSGDLAVWDNRATEHYALSDYGDAHRIVRRVTVTGEPRIAVDGQRSRTVRRPESDLGTADSPDVADARTLRAANAAVGG